MTAVLNHSKRLFVLLFSTMTLASSAAIVTPTLAWVRHWAANRASILLFTGVNTSITTVSEMGSRALWPQVTGEHHQSFFVKTESGMTTIHRQSLINILMTLFASLLGGPVYYIRSKFNRFIFFIGFGLINSLVSQSVSSVLREGIVAVAMSRLIFDFFYNGTIKFFMFEVARPALLKVKTSFNKIAAIRVGQDFLTTFIRVAILNFLGMKG